MTARKQATGYNETDLRIAIGTVLLGTREKAAKFAGISDRNVYNRIENNREWIDQTVKTLEEAMREQRLEMREVASDRFVDELDKLYGAAIDGLREAIAKGDATTAKFIVSSAIDRKLGKPSSSLKITGEVQHTVRAIPPAVEEKLAIFEKFVDQLLLPPVVIDAEAVDDDAS